MSVNCEATGLSSHGIEPDNLSSDGSTVINTDFEGRVSKDDDDSTHSLSSLDHKSKTNPSKRASRVSSESSSRSSVDSDICKTYKCLLCNDEFEDQGKLHWHITLMHETNNCHQCRECGKLFSRLASLSSHTEWHLRMNDLAFSQVENKVASEKDITSCSSRVEQSKSKPIKSLSPSETSKSSAVVKHRISQTTKKPNSSVNVFSVDNIHIGLLTCTFCKETFKSQESLCMHVAANHALKGTAEKSSVSKDTKDSIQKPKKAKDCLQCKSCNQTFLSHEGLKKHKLVVHSDTDLHMCDHCGLSFTSKANLTRHISHSHKKVQRNTSRSSPRASVEKELEVDSLICPICGASFREVSVFQTHLDGHDTSMSVSKIQTIIMIKCDMCPAEYANSRLLEDHVTRQHPNRNSPRNPVLQKTRDCSPSSRSSASPPRSPMSDVLVRAMQPCVICAADGRRMHELSPEKSMSCADCAQFFVENMRLLIFAGKLKCDYKGKCLITRESMESCPPCHLRLCIEMFPVLKKLEEKALSMRKLDTNLLDRTFAILSACLHQSNCRRFINTLQELEKSTRDKKHKKTAATTSKNSAKSDTATKSNACPIASKSGTKESAEPKGKRSKGNVAKKRPSIEKPESAILKKAKTTEEDDTMLYISEEDDVILISEDEADDGLSSSLKTEVQAETLDKKVVQVNTPDKNDKVASDVGASNSSTKSSQEKSSPISKTVAKKRTAGSHKRYSSGSTDTESIATSEKSRTISTEEESSSVADHTESLDRSGLGLDDHLVTLFTRMADWAKPLFWMWTLVPFNLQRLQEYNTKQAEIRPHCSICQLFCDDESLCPEPEPIPVQEGVTFRMSVPVMPESLFRNVPFRCKTGKKTEPAVKEEPQSPTVLVTCTMCGVCVHAKCYGMDMDESVSSWKCAICHSGNVDAECCLCFLRGGALQETTDGRWCHIVCAMGIPDIFFVNVESRKPICVRAVSRERKKLKCRHCATWTKEMRRRGTCAQCWDSTRCCAPLHITCGKAAGDHFKPRHDDARVPVYVICRRHNQKKKTARLRMPKVESGQPVIARAKNGRFYKATVKAQFMEIFYEIDYEDGSVSKDMYPEDIVNRDCLEFGPPSIGSKVDVMWTDKKTYHGTFRGVNNSIVYKVEFEDNSTVKLKREDFYATGETLPEEVRRKLSTATPSKFNFDEVFAQAPVEPRPRCSHYNF